MKAALLVILLVSIGLLHDGADSVRISIYPDFDVQKIAGTWYPVATAWKGRKLTGMIRIDNVLEPSDEGDVVLHVRSLKDGTCVVTDVLAVHTDNPGVFNIPATNEMVYMVDVDYENYHTVYIVQNNTHRLHLLSRTRKTSNDVKKKFTRLAKTLGFDVNKIIYERLAEPCTENF